MYPPNPPSLSLLHICIYVQPENASESMYKLSITKEFCNVIASEDTIELVEVTSHDLFNYLETSLYGNCSWRPSF